MVVKPPPLEPAFDGHHVIGGDPGWQHDAGIGAVEIENRPGSCRLGIEPDGDGQAFIATRAMAWPKVASQSRRGDSGSGYVHPQLHRTSRRQFHGHEQDPMETRLPGVVSCGPRNLP